MQILFQDSELAVCVKPAGLLSQKDVRGRENAVDLLTLQTGSEIFPLHRLDKEVGGLMVYAKNKQAAAFLSTEIAEHRFQKEYLAAVHGQAEPQAFLEDYLFKDSSKNKVYVVKKQRRGVKKAALEYWRLAFFENISVVRVLLHTGRTHQIRVQMASRQMPLVGDRKYGAADTHKQIALWSYRLSFRHPKSRKVLSFSALPETGFLAELYKQQKFNIL